MNWNFKCVNEYPENRMQIPPKFPLTLLRRISGGHKDALMMKIGGEQQFDVAGCGKKTQRLTG